MYFLALRNAIKIDFKEVESQHVLVSEVDKEEQRFKKESQFTRFL